MGSIYEFCEDAHISLKKARQLDKKGWLRLSNDVTPADEIRFTLRTGAQRLSVAQLAYLTENPGSVLELGKYQRLADDQLAAIGNAKAEAAPADVTAYILDAYENDSDAVAVIVRWIKGMLPSKPVGHAYIAARLLLGVDENIRKHDILRLQRVMMNVRKHSEFASWWRTEKHLSRNVTIYQKLALDL